ncbi:MAG: NYN domain-containing protein [Phycisphaerae bacterium]
MVVLIDGYNLLHAARVHVRGSTHLSRSQLCRMLGAWAQAGSHKVVIVFDGRGPEGALAEQLSDPRIEVRQSGAERDADTWLSEHLRQYAGARDACLVSSDRAIQRAARSRRTKCVESDDFFGQLLADLRSGPPPSEPAEKREGLQEEARDAWLVEFGIDGESRGTFEHP